MRKMKRKHRKKMYEIKKLDKRIEGKLAGTRLTEVEHQMRSGERI